MPKNDDKSVMNLLFTSQGWTWHTYRQESAELGISERPKKYFVTDRRPQKIPSEKQNPKNTLLRHDLSSRS